MIANCVTFWLILITATGETVWEIRFGGNDNGSNLSENLLESNSIMDYAPVENDPIKFSQKLICFYTFTNEFDPSIMMDLCTHIIVGFCGIEEKTYGLSCSSEQLQALKRITFLKKKAKRLKILLSVGGADFQGFSSMVKEHSTRKHFIKSAMDTLKGFKIDGIDLDWEWPALNGNVKDKIKFVQLLYEIRREFDRHKKKYLLSVDVSSSKIVSELAYYVQYMARYVDFVSIMCYDYHVYTKWYPFTGHNAPLYPSRNNSIFSYYNVNYSVHYWISNLMPKEKIVLGIPTFGHSYRLSSPQMVYLNAPASGYGSVGLNGFVNYSDVCQFIKQQNATIVFDNASKVPYAYRFPNWVSYDNEMSLTHKVNYAKKEQLSGIMIFSVNADDSSGICNGDGIPLPLVRKVKSILFDQIRKPITGE